jgi:hypothetical protein
MQRWTIPNVSAAAIREVQSLSADSGASLGDVVTACIDVGLGQVRQRLLAERDVAAAPASHIGSHLDDLFRCIRLLSNRRQ